ncbi:hypothetical protein ETD83_31055 [Actinomadura soli]|uniref:Uncharacterized protein n=1 Tax=Actinomadura soli TaxID=2508997 RepID=A0A5C4J3M5_9ACTN|nr:hypothetical protein ETD83_31055 [Actinomadura soli]
MVWSRCGHGTGSDAVGGAACVWRRAGGAGRCRQADAGGEGLDGGGAGRFGGQSYRPGKRPGR